MDVDAAPGASPMVASDSAVPPGSPGGSHPAPGEAVGLPPELARPPPGECSLKMKVGYVGVRQAPAEPRDHYALEAHC